MGNPMVSDNKHQHEGAVRVGMAALGRVGGETLQEGAFQLGDRRGAAWPGEGTWLAPLEDQKGGTWG